MKRPTLKFEEKYRKTMEQPRTPPPQASLSTNQLRSGHYTRQQTRTNRKPDFLKHLGKPGPFQDKKQQKRSIKEPIGIRQTIGSHPIQKQTDKIKSSKPKQLRQTIKTESSEYQRLNDKLDFIQSKINQMSSNIDLRREEKKSFLELERKERQKRMEKHAAPEQKKLKESLHKFVTQVSEGKDYVSANFNPYSPRSNTYYVAEVLKMFKEERSLVRQHIAMSAQYLRIFENIRVPTQEEAKARMVKMPCRPGYQDKKTIIFDLDETLIHCNDSLDIPYDIKIKIKFPTGQQIEAGINIRPYAVEILRALSKNFEVIVFTASHSCYANVVLDYLDPKGQHVQHRLYRQHCHITSQGVYVKDLRIIDRDMSQMVLVDNAAYSYAFQLDNAIPILPYYKGKNDYELKALQTYIQGMIFAKDVREVGRKTFKLHQYCQFDGLEGLVRELYGQFK